MTAWSWSPVTDWAAAHLPRLSSNQILTSSTSPKELGTQIQNYRRSEAVSAKLQATRDLVAAHMSGNVFIWALGAGHCQKSYPILGNFGLSNFIFHHLFFCFILFPTNGCVFLGKSSRPRYTDRLWRALLKSCWCLLTHSFKSITDVVSSPRAGVYRRQDWVSQGDSRSEAREVIPKFATTWLHPPGFLLGKSWKIPGFWPLGSLGLFGIRYSWGTHEIDGSSGPDWPESWGCYLLGFNPQSYRGMREWGNGMIAKIAMDWITPPIPYVT